MLQALFIASPYYVWILRRIVVKIFAHLFHDVRLKKIARTVAEVETYTRFEAAIEVEEVIPEGRGYLECFLLRLEAQERNPRTRLLTRTPRRLLPGSP